MRRILLTVVLVLWTASVQASQLSTLAAALKPGTWQQLKTPAGAKLFVTIIDGIEQGSILEAANKLAWDPTAKKAYYCGSSHIGGVFRSKCLVWDDATNTVTQLTLPAGVASDTTNQGASFTHGYDNNTFDTTRGLFYMRHGNQIVIYNGASVTWTRSADIPADCRSDGNQATSMQYFPEMDRVVFFNSSCNPPTGNAVWNPGTQPTVNGGSWSTSTGNVPSGGAHTVSAYANGFVYAGCGNNTTNISRRAATGSWSAVQAAPGACGVNYGGMFSDPISGKLLYFQSNNNIFELHPTNLAWSSTGQVSRWLYRGALGAVPVSNYGVILMVRHPGSSIIAPEFWVYKHAALRETQ